MSPRSITAEEFKERESELILLGRSLVDEDCLSTLTIDKLVSESRFSKGTIYKHFVSKEDLLMAICNHSIEELQAIFLKALKYDGSTREKALATMTSYVIWAKLNPSQLFAVLAAHSPSVAACCSENRNITHKEHETSLMASMGGLISEALDVEDLILSKNMTIERVTFALWSAAWGAMALIMSKGDSIKLEPMQLERESFTNARLILDGLNWKPLSTDWDYKASIKKITESIFKAELATLEKNGTPFIFY